MTAVVRAKSADEMDVALDRASVATNQITTAIRNCIAVLEEAPLMQGSSGELVKPREVVAALGTARAEIESAIEAARRTDWPSAFDYLLRVQRSGR